MADFIAVIRRAVDGLTDNTPEMRVKVYERAREYETASAGSHAATAA
jgi:diaminopimelate epimerase